MLRLRKEEGQVTFKGKFKKCIINSTLLTKEKIKSNVTK